MKFNNLFIMICRYISAILSFSLSHFSRLMNNSCVSNVFCATFYAVQILTVNSLIVFHIIHSLLFTALVIKT
jgi:hypothetical protein